VAGTPPTVSSVTPRSRTAWSQDGRVRQRILALTAAIWHNWATVELSSGRSSLWPLNPWN